jgi:hypothetical protein
MSVRLLPAIAVAAFAALSAPAFAADPPKAAEIALADPAGRAVRLGDFANRKATVAVFLARECPMSNTYIPKLIALDRQFAAKGVQFTVIYTGETDSPAAAAHAKEFGITFPVLIDGRNAVAGAVGAEVTPEVAVLDKSGKVVYRGRIDDRYTARLQSKDNISSDDLAAALEAVLAGKAPSAAVTKAFGCPIFRKQAAPVAGAPTYHKDVEPILQRHCQTCHRPGQVGPFSLMTYEQASNWADDIKDFAARRVMPPWKPSDYGPKLVGDRRLTEAEIAVLAKWADAGAPRGDPKQAPAARTFRDEWALGTPDLILEPTEFFELEAQGRDVFRCFVLPTNLKEDRYVVAFELRPGNTKVVHHALLFFDTGGRARKLDEADAGPGYGRTAGGIGFAPSGGLGGWAPGNMPHYLPDGCGKRLPAGSDVVVQIHYHKSGKPEKDRTRVGLYFAKSAPAKLAHTFPLASRRLVIPAGDEHYRTTATMTVPADVQVIGVTPHMHLLGRQMKVTATLPDGKVQPLIDIPDWDFNWQDSYYFKEPVKLPRGTKIDLEARYDNSAKNPRNPSSPPRLVTWGEQTTNEMCIAFLHFTTPNVGNLLDLLKRRPKAGE